MNQSFRRLHAARWIALLILPILCIGCPPPDDAVQPAAAFSASPTAGPPGLAVVFSDESVPGSAAIGSWLWNFGDGATSGDQHPTHVYAAEGVYTVSLTVTTPVATDTEVQADLIVVSLGPDTTPPVISLNGPAEAVLECGVAWDDPGASAVDERDPLVTVVVGGDQVSPAPGTYHLTYDAVDAAGNEAAQVTRTVRVVDTSAPVISMTGSDTTVECGAPFEDSGAVATDACEGSVDVVATGSPDTGAVGNYVITYTATDSFGNAAAPVQRRVTIVDSTPPQISMNGGDMSLYRGETFEDLGATAWDACEGEVAVSVSGDLVNTEEPGLYVIVYEARDAAGQVAQETRQVTVIEPCAATDPWAQIYGLGDHEDTIGGFETSDCAYVMYGARLSTYSRLDELFVMKVDVEGMPLWNLSLDTSDSEYDEVAAIGGGERSDGSIALLVVWSIRSQGLPATYTHCLYVLDQTGAVLSQEMREGLEFLPAEIVMAADESFWIIGERLEPHAYESRYRAVAARITPDGELDWQTPLATGLNPVLAVEEPGSAHVAAWAYAESATGSWRSIGLYLARLSMDGEIEAAEIKEAYNGFQPSSLVAARDGGLILSATRNRLRGEDSALPKYRPALLRWNAEGSLAWEHVGPDPGVGGRILEHRTGDVSVVQAPFRDSEADISIPLLVRRFSAAGQVLRETAYADGFYFKAGALLSTRDAGLLVIGGASGLAPGTKGDPFLLKVDAAGTMPGTPAFFDTAGRIVCYPNADVDPITLVRGSDSGFLLVGERRIQGALLRILTVKTDAFGAPEWFQYLDNTAEVTAAVAAPDGGFVLTGSTNDGLFDPLVMKLAQDGTVAWRWTDPLPGEQLATDVVELDNGHFFIYGETWDGNPRRLKERLWVCLDGDGELQWKQQLPGDTSVSGPVLALETGALVLMNGPNYLLRSVLDNTGGSVSHAFVDVPDRLTALDLQAAGPGAFVLFGRRWSDTGPLVGYAQRFGIDGTSEWRREYPNSQQILAAAPIEDGAFVVVMKTVPGIVLGRIEADGTLTWTETPGPMGEAGSAILADEAGYWVLGDYVGGQSGFWPTGLGLFQMTTEGVTDRVAEEEF